MIWAVLRIEVHLIYIQVLIPNLNPDHRFKLPKIVRVYNEDFFVSEDLYEKLPILQREHLALKMNK